ncbi:hypothetical protein BCR33DRAFT_747353 [Rhizoclosmatium globosum]|uniref:Uncharacterized protein n=1 Tax=Rhizoclosmatium globosum TaxID=329046 RepID=A0A1Y2AT58_9FUNG|nr:hypothetical protein BCR33DRAFT_747353 [Rhizoclosmatium globosum]|eukprot:ORY25480.1 hypothetical protein BCR33DRAFT_747353 [Rhizoclosmatium globosum]
MIGDLLVVLTGNVLLNGARLTGQSYSQAQLAEKALELRKREADLFISLRTSNWGGGIQSMQTSWTFKTTVANVVRHDWRPPRGPHCHSSSWLKRRVGPSKRQSPMYVGDASNGFTNKLPHLLSFVSTPLFLFIWYYSLFFSVRIIAGRDRRSLGLIQIGVRHDWRPPRGPHCHSQQLAEKALELRKREADLFISLRTSNWGGGIQSMQTSWTFKTTVANVVRHDWRPPRGPHCHSQQLAEKALELRKREADLFISLRTSNWGGGIQSMQTSWTFKTTVANVVRHDWRPPRGPHCHSQQLAEKALELRKREADLFISLRTSNWGGGIQSMQTIWTFKTTVANVVRHDWRPPRGPHCHSQQLAEKALELRKREADLFISLRTSNWGGGIQSMQTSWTFKTTVANVVRHDWRPPRGPHCHSQQLAEKALELRKREADLFISLRTSNWGGGIQSMQTSWTFKTTVANVVRHDWRPPRGPHCHSQQLAEKPRLKRKETKAYLFQASISFIPNSFEMSELLIPQ